jgi:hypothetical protein
MEAHPYGSNMYVNFAIFQLIRYVIMSALACFHLSIEMMVASRILVILLSGGFVVQTHTQRWASNRNIDRVLRFGPVR